MIILTIIPQADGRGGRSPSSKCIVKIHCLKIYFNDDFNNNLHTVKAYPLKEYY